MKVLTVKDLKDLKNLVKRRRLKPVSTREALTLSNLYFLLEQEISAQTAKARTDENNNKEDI